MSRDQDAFSKGKPWPQVSKGLWSQLVMGGAPFIGAPCLPHFPSFPMYLGPGGFTLVAKSGTQVTKALKLEIRRVPTFSKSNW